MTEGVQRQMRERMAVGNIEHGSEKRELGGNMGMRRKKGVLYVGTPGGKKRFRKKNKRPGKII